jgi:WD40 repeat protein
MLQFPSRLKAAHLEAVVSGNAVQVYATNPTEFNVMRVQGSLTYKKPGGGSSPPQQITHHSGHVCTFSPTTGKYFAIGHSEATISLFETKTGIMKSQIRVSTDPRAPASLHASTAAAKMLLGSPISGSSSLSSSSGGGAPSSLAGSGAFGSATVPNITTLLISKNEDFIYYSIGAFLCTLRIDPTTGELSELGSALRSTHSSVIIHLSLSPCKNFVCSSCTDGTFEVWNVTPQSELAERLASPIGADPSSPSTPGVKFRAPNYAARPLPMHALRGFTAGKAVCSVFSPDSSTVFGVAQGDPHIRSWDAKKGTEGRLKPLRTGHTTWITSIAISPDGKLLATSSRDMTVRFFDIEKWNQIESMMLKIKDDSSPITKVFFAPSSTIPSPSSPSPSTPPPTYFVFTLNDRNVIDRNVIRIWNANEQNVVEEFQFETSTELRGFSIHPQGEVLALTASRYSSTGFFSMSFGRKILRPSSTTDNNCVFPFDKGMISKFAFSSDLTQLRVQQLETKQTKTLELGKVAVHAVGDREKVFIPAARPFGGAVFLKAESSDRGGSSGGGLLGRVISLSADAYEGKVGGIGAGGGAPSSPGDKRKTKSPPSATSSAKLLEAIAKRGVASSSMDRNDSSTSTSSASDSVAAFMREFEKKAKARDVTTTPPPPPRANNNNKRYKDNEDDDDSSRMESSVYVLPAQRPFGMK